MTDLDEFERLARGTDGGLGDDDPWPTAGDIAGGFSWNHLEAAYIAAASPDVILDLIARVRAAEGTVAMLSDEIRRKGLTSGSAMAAHLDVELDLIDRVRAAEAQVSEARSIAEHYLAESASIRSDEALVRLTDVCEEIREATTKP